MNCERGYAYVRVSFSSIKSQIIIMHKSFVTTAPQPQGLAGFLSSRFLLIAPCGDTKLVKALPFSPAVCFVFIALPNLPL